MKNNYLNWIIVAIEYSLLNYVQLGVFKNKELFINNQIRTIFVLFNHKIDFDLKKAKFTL